MAKQIIGNYPVDITKDGDTVRIVFHPISKNAKHPDANVFTLRIKKKDLETIKDAF